MANKKTMRVERPSVGMAVVHKTLGKGTIVAAKSGRIEVSFPGWGTMGFDVDTDVEAPRQHGSPQIKVPVSPESELTGPIQQPLLQRPLGTQRRIRATSRKEPAKSPLEAPVSAVGVPRPIRASRILAQVHKSVLTSAMRPVAQTVPTLSPDVNWWYGKLRTSKNQAAPQVIQAKVVGVTFGGRQQTIASLSVGTMVLLTREPNNAYDANAIGVGTLDGDQIGYLDRALAATLAAAFDRHGSPVSGTAIEIVGSGSNGYNLGVKIQFELDSANVPVRLPDDLPDYDGL